MSTKPLKSDDRSVSEVYGTVLVISLSFIMAISLFGFGMFVMDNFGGETEERITQDAMVEMDDRLAEITGSSVDTGTTFSFPDTDADTVETESDHGIVNVSVETTEDTGYLQASEEVNSTEFAVGTVRHTASDGEVIAYQGGALIRQEGAFSTMLNDPPFDYDGTMVDFDFVDTTEMPDIRPGQEITASSNTDGSQTFTEEIESLLSPKWSYMGEGDFIAPVNITVSIETEFYEAWEVYAKEGMTESPDSVETDSAAELVKMKFNQVGTEEQLSGYAENQILYAGPAEDISEGFNRFNDNASITGTENGFFANPTEENEAAFQNQKWQLAYYDEERGEWLRLGQSNNPDQPPRGNPEWFDINPNEENVVHEDATSPVEIDDYDRTNDYVEFELNESHSDVPLCLISYDENINSADSDGVIEYLEICAANMPNSGEYMPADLEISFENSSYDLTKGNETNLTVEIENVGNVDSESGNAIALYYEFNETLNLIGSLSSEYIGVIESKDSHEEEFQWEPPNTDIDEIYAAVGSHDVDNASVNITDEGLNVTETSDFFEMEEDISVQESIVPGQPLTLQPTINNSGTEDGEQSITLTAGGSNAILDVETEELDVNESTEVSLTWDTPTTGTQIIEINTEDYTKVLEVDVSNPLYHDRALNTPLDIGLGLIEFDDS